MRNKPNHIRWGVVLTYVSLGINILLSILFTPLMLQILGQNEHGLYSTVSSTMSWLSLLGLGISSSYIYFYARYNAKKDDEAIASLNGLFLIIFFIIGAISILCGMFIANNLKVVFADGMTESEYATARILAIIVTIDLSIGFPASVFGAIINANERFIQSKSVNLFQNIFTPLLTLPLLLAGYGSIGMIAVTTAIDFFAYTFNVIYCFKNLHIQIRFHGFERGIVKGIFGYSFFIALNSVISQFATGLDKLFITRFVNTAAASVYAIGCSLFSYYSAFSGAVSGVFAPRVQKITAEYIDDKVQLKRRLTEQFIKIGRIQFLIQMLMLTGIVFLGRSFIHQWAERGGQDYSGSYPIALLLCVSSTVPLIQNIGVTIQRSQNKHRYRTLFYGIMTALNVVLTIWLCQVVGAIGAAIGTAVATVLLDVVVMNIYYQRHLFIDVPLFWKSVLKMSRGLIIPVILGVLINRFIVCDTLLKLILCILSYTAIYCVSMWFLGIDNEEKNLFKSVLLHRKHR